jgi:hypothetical protein
MKGLLKNPLMTLNVHAVAACPEHAKDATAFVV